MKLDAKTVLLIIDVQKGLDLRLWGPRSTPEAESNMKLLLDTWRASNAPVVHIQHHSNNPDSPLRPELETCAIKDVVSPIAGEKWITKSTNSAFIGTGLEDYLKDQGYQTIVAIGLTSDHCVSATVRMSGDLGFNTFVVSDATACFGHEHQGQQLDAETVHAVSLATLHEEFATVISTESLLNML